MTTTGYYLEDLAIAMEASVEKKVSADDINAFAAITGDYNPIHIDDDYAAQTPFQTRIAHGMLNGGLISAVLGNQLPGPGCVYIEQQLKFRAPVKINDIVLTKVIIESIDTRRGRVTLATNCYVNDKLVTSGSAMMIVNKRSS